MKSHFKGQHNVSKGESITMLAIFISYDIDCTYHACFMYQWSLLCVILTAAVPTENMQYIATENL